jgi:hypothetical protein
VVVVSKKEAPSAPKAAATKPKSVVATKVMPSANGLKAGSCAAGVYDFMRKHRRNVTTVELAEHLQVASNNVRQALFQLGKKNMVVATGRGVYKLA